MISAAIRRFLAWSNSAFRPPCSNSRTTVDLNWSRMNTSLRGFRRPADETATALVIDAEPSARNGTLAGNVEVPHFWECSAKFAKPDRRGRPDRCDSDQDRDQTGLTARIRLSYGEGEHQRDGHGQHHWPGSILSKR